MRIIPTRDAWTRAAVVLAGVGLALTALWGVAGRGTPTASADLPRIVTSRPLAAAPAAAAPAVVATRGASAPPRTTAHRPAARANARAASSSARRRESERQRATGERHEEPAPAPAPAAEPAQSSGGDQHEVVVPTVREQSVPRHEE